MNLRDNINKIHIELSNKFESVNISEKSSLTYGNYFELSITEGNKNVKAIISKTDLEGNKFNWKYYSNPLNESSDLVDRTSMVEGFQSDISDIFEKNRFDSDYIENIK
jgi:hypothetical protein